MFYSRKEQETKVSGEWRTQGKGPHDDVEVRVAYSFIHAPALAYFLAGVELTPVRFTKEQGRWLLMLLGERPRMRVVAFVSADTYREAIVLCATYLDTNSVPWKESKPPPWERD